jgi:type I restriction-modification system DNA methylase subunit
MTDTNQKQLGNTLWSIADQLRGAMDADDFRDYMISFLFLRYLSDNYETAAKKALGRDYPDVGGDTLTASPRAVYEVKVQTNTVHRRRLGHAEMRREHRRRCGFTTKSTKDTKGERVDSVGVLA